MERRIAVPIGLLVFALSLVSAMPSFAAARTTHAALDGTVTYWQTFLGVKGDKVGTWTVKECQTTKVGWEYYGWGYDGWYEYDPGGAVGAGIINQQVATFDVTSHVMGSIDGLLIDKGYTDVSGAWLMVPGFYSGSTTLYASVDLASWAGHTYTWKGLYSFAGGANSSLPGIKLATTPWAYVAGTGWTVGSDYLWSGEATLGFESGWQGQTTPELGTWALLGCSGAMGLTLMRRRRKP